MLPPHLQQGGGGRGRKRIAETVEHIFFLESYGKSSLARLPSPPLVLSRGGRAARRQDNITRQHGPVPPQYAIPRRPWADDHRQGN